MFRHAFSFVRSSRQCSSKEGFHLLAERLSNRSLIRISGDSVSDYLQGLVTNDVKHLESDGSCMFAMFLNTKGRVLFESIIYHGSKNEMYLECDATVKSEFMSHLKMFKVRRKISVDDMQDQFSLWTINLKSIVHDIFVNDEPLFRANTMKNNVEYLQKMIPAQFFSDPRIVMLGTRVIVPNESDLITKLKANNMNITEGDFYRRLRYRLGVGEGISELPCGNCFPLEANCDYLHGISFHKGCYIGQELTARTYHTGVIRKRIMPLTFSANKSVPKFHSPITLDTQGKAVGKFLSRHGNNGIGLLRIDDVLKESQLTINDLPCSTFRPFWWPVEAPKGRPS